MNSEEKIIKKIESFSKQENINVLTDEVSKIIYSTDASAYREKPLAIALPKTEEEVIKIIKFCNKEKINLIPRAAGTSLAGQVVGKGLVIDCSKYFNHIISVDSKEKTVEVECGVVRDSLNNYLKPYNLFFSPETSTSNRCCIGGMVGNNSCGLHSIAWGTVRENIKELHCILSDGSIAVFKDLTKQEFIEKTKQQNLEGKIYKYIYETYSKEEVKKEINDNFPDKDVIRRNNGFALDELLDFDKINLCRLISGSEGTFCFIVKAKLKLRPLPSNHRVVICIHFNSLKKSFVANLICLKQKPIAVELMDDNIINAAKRNIGQRDNLFFVKNNPKAIIVDEICKDNEEELNRAIEQTIKELKENNLGYCYPIIKGDDIKRVWNLRKAGLGLLTNVPGNNKPVSVIEDTAVAVKYLPDYMRDFGELLKKHNLSCVYHAHIASGELHLRPVLNLKKEQDVKIFKTISKEVALLVKKYHGSLSGEHGDGRLRGEYIPLMFGDKVYSLMKQMKQVWDKDNIFNYQKIIDTPAMNTFLRYDFLHKDYDFNKTYYSFEKEKGFLCAIEQCNGVAVCRKNTEFLETMCPSFRIHNNDERFSTRARANILREFLTYPKKNNPFDNKDIYDMLSSCLSCKGCKKECPSNVDMAKIKSEFLQHYYKVNGLPLNVFFMSYLTAFEKIGSLFPIIYNFFVKNKITSYCIKYLMSFSQKRSLPTLNKHTCKKELINIISNSNKTTQDKKKTIYVFIDEFTNFEDSKIGVCAVQLFIGLGYNVKIAPISNSGRVLFSKGLVRRAKYLAKHNIKKMLPLINDSTPLVGIEPSTILSFRDEYPCLTDKNIETLTKNCFCFDEFISNEIDNGNISSSQFTNETKHLLYHTHCQQKAIVGEKYMQKILSIPTNYTAEGIKSGCCGRAGSFGYEKKHYQESEEIVHQIIIPVIKKANKDTIIVASGTSCREQIHHFANKQPLHPLQVLYDALNK